jgi:hypothetical protein
MIACPTNMPVTTPVELFTVAVVGALLVQVPPEGVELSVVVADTFTAVVPVIAETAGADGATVIVVLMVPLQPVLVPVTV